MSEAQKEKKLRRKRAGGFLLFFVLLALLGFAFYYGLPRRANFAALTVVYRQSRGFQPEVLENGKFYWFWDRLVPGFFFSQDFVLDVQQLDVDLDWQLPQAELYRDFVVGAPDFRYQLQMVLDYQLRPAALLPLLDAEQTFGPDSLAGFYRQQEGRLRQAFLDSFSAGSEPLPADPGAAGSQLLQLGRQIAGDTLEILSLNLRVYQSPEPEIYRLAQDNYREFSRQNGARLLQEAVLELLLEDSSNRQLTYLQQLGTTLAQYPQVIDYLKLFSGEEANRQPKFNSFLKPNILPAETDDSPP